MTEITETICRPKQSWMTAPGISKENETTQSREAKVQLQKAIEAIYDLPSGSLTMKKRHLAIACGKHIFRFILERLQVDGTIAEKDVRRGRVPTNMNLQKKSYIQRDARWGSYRVMIKRNKVSYSKFTIATIQEAIDARDRLLSKVESNPFKYTIGEVAVLINTDHASVLHSCRTFSNLFETDRTFRAKAQIILEKISNNQIIMP